MRLRSTPFAFQCSTARRMSSLPTWPTISLNVRKPSFAISSRTSSAMKKKKLITCSGWPVKRLAQHRVLRRDADRAGVQMALAHHDAAGGDQRRGGEAELVGAEQRADHHVAPGAQAAIHLHRDAAAQAVQHQRLLRLGQADLPRRAGMRQRGQRRRAGAALEAGDRHVIRARLRHAGGDRADADLGHQLHRNPRLRIGVLQIGDELRQILDRIDVVMRRRRDQARRPVSNSARGRCSCPPCGRATDRPRRAWRPAPS